MESRLSSIRVSKSIFIKQNFSQFTSEYKVGVELGSGSFGTVRKCTHIKTGQVRAVKIIPKENSDKVMAEISTLKKELEILRCLDHPNIVRIYEYYEDAKRFYFVIEYCEGGDLLQKIKDLGRLTEPMAAQIMKQVLSAVAYCHANNVVHRDLKPENIILDAEGLNGTIKVTDFGTSDVFDPNHCMTTQSGTSFYIAPEVLKNSYNAKCDVWSTGVLLYVLLAGYPPFTGKDDNEIIVNVAKGKYTMIGEGWDTVSKEAKALVKRMLTFNPEKRITALEALKNPWVLKHNSVDNDIFSIAVLALPTLDNLKKYKAVGILKKATMIYIVSQLIEDKKKSKMLRLFLTLDVDGDGSLTKKDFVEGYRLICKAVIPKDLEQVFNSIDITMTGTIDYNEFLVAALSDKDILTETNIREAFNVIDKEQKGVITVSAISDLLGSGKAVPKEMIARIIKEVNPDSDGKITFERFKNTMLATTE